MPNITQPENVQPNPLSKIPIVVPGEMRETSRRDLLGYLPEDMGGFEQSVTAAAKMAQAALARAEELMQKIIKVRAANLNDKIQNELSSLVNTQRYTSAKSEEILYSLSEPKYRLIELTKKMDTQINNSLKNQATGEFGAETRTMLRNMNSVAERRIFVAKAITKGKWTTVASALAAPDLSGLPDDMVKLLKDMYIQHRHGNLIKTKQAIGGIIAKIDRALDYVNKINRRLNQGRVQRAINKRTQAVSSMEGMPIKAY